MRKTNRVRPYSARIALLAGALATVSLPLADMTAMAAAGIVKVGSQQRSQTIKLGLNKSVVLDLPQDAYDVLVSNPTIADAVTRTSRRIYLFGKQVGQTNIFVFGQNGEQVASIDVEIERDVSGLSSQLKRLIPGSDIRVELINDNVVLTGTVQTRRTRRRPQSLPVFSFPVAKQQPVNIQPRPRRRPMAAVSPSTIPTGGVGRAPSSICSPSSARIR